MLRIIHTADVHLGARHDDLGEQAAAQRERQFAAFKAAIDLALAEKVDLVLIAGDLFDSNVQPRRSVERVAAELKRLVEARIRTRHHPGHARRLRPRVDLPRLRPRGDGRQRAGRRPGHRPRPRPPVGPPDARSTWSSTARCSPRSARRTARSRAVGRVGEPATRRDRRRDLADRAGPRLDRDPGQDRARRGRHHDRRDRRHAASTTSRSATGTRPRRARPAAVTLRLRGRARGRSRSTRTAPARSSSSSSRSGPASEPVTVEERQVGRTRFEKVELDAATVGQPAGARRRSSRARADPDLVLDVRLVGVRRDELDLHVDEVETALAPSFLKVRVRDALACRP